MVVVTTTLCCTNGLTVDVGISDCSRSEVNFIIAKLRSEVLADILKLLIENSGMQHLLIIAGRCFDISK